MVRCNIADQRWLKLLGWLRLPGTAETDFAPQLDGLADALQVVAFDPRGYGQSRPPARDFPLDFYQVAKQCPQLGVV